MRGSPFRSQGAVGACYLTCTGPARTPAPEANDVILTVGVVHQKFVLAPFGAVALLFELVGLSSEFGLIPD